MVRAVNRGAGELDGPEVRRAVGHERLLSTAPSFTRPRWLTVVLLVLAFGPVVVLGTAGASAQDTQRTRAVNSSASGGSSRSVAPARSDVGLSLGARLLEPGSGEQGPGGSEQVRELQRRLTELGFSSGAVDGRYGPRTEQAVMSFQSAHGLPVDGVAGPETLAALAAPIVALYPGAGYQSGGSSAVRVLQRRLTELGFLPGAVDGLYGPRTERAVSRFQATDGLRADGIADPVTLSRLEAQTGSDQRSGGGLGRVGTPVSATRKPAASSHQTDGVARGDDSAGRSSFAWLLLVAALVLGLVVLVAWRGMRRRAVGASLPSPEPHTVEDREDAVPVQTRQQPDAGAPQGHVMVTQVAAPREPARVPAGSQLANEHGDADGAFSLGVLLERQGDTAGALAAYRRADECGDGPAACNLGVLLEEQGDTAGALASYRRARQRGDANGAFNLGVLLEGQGDIAGALGAYRRADQCGHGPAACNLGVLLEGQGDAAGALAAYGRAAQRGDANGAFNLGSLLEERGDLVGAVAAYDRARHENDARVAQMDGQDQSPQLSAAGNAGDKHRV